jgi:hypothetical protein
MLHFALTRSQRLGASSFLCTLPFVRLDVKQKMQCFGGRAALLSPGLQPGPPTRAAFASGGVEAGVSEANE